MMKRKKILDFIGPGLMYAGAAIGVSHLVQSTRAGALFGFQLFAIVVLVNFLKYPFFETGSRYSGATGKTLIQAYAKMNKGLLYFYLLQTFLTMFIIQSALTIVSTGLLKTLLNIDIPNWIISSSICLACILILFIGQYKSLKNFTKWIVISLSFCTLFAVCFAIFKPVNIVENNLVFSFKDAGNIAFLVALMGWMPAPIDISVWQSVWRVDGEEEVNLKKSLIDFHIGYWGTAIISLAFLSLGALIFFHSGEALSTSGSVFAAQLVSMYTTAIGKWAWPIVAFAAFATMFTTCLTCLDANPRVIQRTVEEMGYPRNKAVYVFLIFCSAIAAVLIPMLSGKSMTALVDFATTVSFMTAPVFATLNYKLNFSKELSKEQQPGMFNKVISWIGLIFLYAFAFYFLGSKFFF